MEGVFRFKSWFLNAPALIHGRVYYRNFTAFELPPFVHRVYGQRIPLTSHACYDLQIQNGAREFESVPPTGKVIAVFLICPDVRCQATKRKCSVC